MFKFAYLFYAPVQSGFHKNFIGKTECFVKHCLPSVELTRINIVRLIYVFFISIFTSLEKAVQGLAVKCNDVITNSFRDATG